MVECLLSMRLVREDRPIVAMTVHFEPMRLILFYFANLGFFQLFQTLSADLHVNFFFA